MDERQQPAGDLEDREAALQRGWEALAHEKDTMQKVKAKHTDIIELNVGGTLFSTSRGTLCAEPGTVLEFMFSGRWENAVQLDKNDAAFLDFDPELFGLLLNHLRDKTLSGPEEKLALPKLLAHQSNKQRTYEKMLSYLGFISSTADEREGCFSRQRSDASFGLSLEGKTATLQVDWVDKTRFAKVCGVCETGKSITFRVRENAASGSMKDAKNFIMIGVMAPSAQLWMEGYFFARAKKYVKKVVTTLTDITERHFVSGDTLTLSLDTKTGVLTLSNITTGKTSTLEGVDTSQQYVFAMGGSTAGLTFEILD